MARDPLEGVRPSDMSTREGLSPVAGGGGAGRSTVIIVALLLGVVIAVATGALVFLASRPSASVGGTQVTTPEPGPTLTPLAVPSGTPTLEPPAPPPVPNDTPAPAQHE